MFPSPYHAGARTSTRTDARCTTMPRRDLHNLMPMPSSDSLGTPTASRPGTRGGGASPWTSRSPASALRALHRHYSLVVVAALAAVTAVAAVAAATGVVVAAGAAVAAVPSVAAVPVFSPSGVRAPASRSVAVVVAAVAAAAAVAAVAAGVVAAAAVPA